MEVYTLQENYNPSRFSTTYKPVQYFINDEGCWISLSHPIYKGNDYSRIGRNGKYHKLHRYVYTLFKGEISKGKILLHSCDNTSCINPEHLSIGTQKDNVGDMINKGREKHGGRYKAVTLEQKEQILDLFYNSNLKVSEICERVGVSKYTFYKVTQGRHRLSQMEV